MGSKILLWFHITCPAGSWVVPLIFYHVPHFGLNRWEDGPNRFGQKRIQNLGSPAFGQSSLIDQCLVNLVSEAYPGQIYPHSVLAIKIYCSLLIWFGHAEAWNSSSIVLSVIFLHASFFSNVDVHQHLYLFPATWSLSFLLLLVLPSRSSLLILGSVLSPCICPLLIIKFILLCCLSALKHP